MKLLQLRLENFRQHRDSCITFSDGMTAVVGANGTGKTTLLEAVTFALYGEQRDNLENIKFFWSDGKRYAATLQFEFGGTVYEVCRTHVDAHLRTLGDNAFTLASSKTDVKRACEKLLGLNYEQFINSFCAEQKNLGFLNFKTNSAQQDEVARMLGFDRLKQAEELARQRRRNFENEIKGGRAMLGDPLELEAQRLAALTALQEVTSRIAESQLARSAILKQLPEAKIARERAESFLQLASDMRAIEAKAEGLKSALKQAEAAFAVAQKDSAEKAELEVAETQYREMENQLVESEKLRESERQREALLQQKANLDQEIARLKEKAADVPVPDLAKVEAAVALLTQAASSARQEVEIQDRAWKAAQLNAQGVWQRAVAEANQLKDSLNQAEAMIAKGTCPECGQPVSESMKKGLTIRKAEWEKRDRERLKLEKAVRDLSQPPAALTAAVQSQTEAETDLKQGHEARQEAMLAHQVSKGIELDLKNRETQLKEISDGLAVLPSNYDRGRHEALARKLNDLRPQHERFLALVDADQRLAITAKSKEAADKELEAERTRYGELKAQRNSTGFAQEEEAQTAIETHRRLDSDLKIQDAAIATSESAHKQAEIRHNEAVTRLSERAKRDQELKELEQLEAVHEVAQRELRALREELNKSIRPDLIARASENLSILTNGRYPLLDLDKNFKPILLDDNVVKHVISGGEEDVVALSLRLALSELIQEMSGHPMSLLILDEVFGSLDAERRQSVLERLIGLKNRFSQIFIISHIEEINQIADQCIYLSRDPVTKATVVADAMPEQIALEL